MRAATFAFVPIVAGVMSLTLNFRLDGVGGEQLSEGRNPLLTVVRLDRAPTLDGKVTEPEWSGAAAESGFTRLGDGGSIHLPARFWVGWDSEAIYVASRVTMPSHAKPKAACQQHDGPVWEDDAIELFLQPNPPHGSYYQFIGNAFGTRWESLGRDGSWNADWEFRASTAKGYWESEFRIPFAALGAKSPQIGEVWGFNLCVDRQGNGSSKGGSAASENLSWAPLESSFHEPERFGRLRFALTGTAVQIEQLGREGNAILCRGRLAGSQLAPPSARVSMMVHRQEKQGLATLFQQNLSVPQQTGGQEFLIRWELPKTEGFATAGKYSVQVQVFSADGGEKIYARWYPVSVAEPLLITLRPYHVEGKLEVDLDIKGLERAPTDVRAAVSLRHAKSGKEVASQSVASFLDSGKQILTFSIGSLALGEYQVEVELMDKEGKSIVRRSQNLTRPPRPPWLGSKEGLSGSEKVLPPWTPLRVKERGWKHGRRGSRRPYNLPAFQPSILVSCWGREYEYAGTLFPSRVLTREAAVLAAPIRLLATFDGKQLNLTEGKVKVVEAKPNKVGLEFEGGMQPFNVKATTVIEYDGMIRTDFQIASKQQVRLERLVLEVPFKPEHAKYLYHFPGRWGSAYNAGALPIEGFKSGFRPFIWLGDEDRGFCWFCESDENWFNKDPNRVTEIVREGEKVILRLHLVEAPTLSSTSSTNTKSVPHSAPTIPHSLTYTFGFQATPVKHPDKDVWDYRIVHEGRYGLEKQPWRPHVTLTYPAKGNINLEQGTLEAWVIPTFDPKVEVDPKDPQRSIYNRDFFQMHLPDPVNATVGFYWNIDDRGMRFYVHRGGKYPIIMGSPAGKTGWKRGEKHHVALTWGKEARIYVDGKLMVSRPFAGLVGEQNIPLPEGSRLQFGGGACEFIVDEIRISDLPREAFELEREMDADANTLLLDHLNESFTPDDMRQTRAARISGASGEVGGVLGSAGGFMEARFGKGVRLFGEAKEGKELTWLDKLSADGVRTIVFHEHWTDIQNYISTTRGEELKSLVKACHERGIQLLLYFGYEMSNIAPEWPHYSDECLVFPRAGGYHRQPEQRAYIVCYRSHWQDFLAQGIARIMDEYDIDGVYLDGTEYPWGCRNVHHGCGYRKPDGSIGTTYSFFATREMMRRIYTIVKTRKPNGQVNVHNSTVMTIPTLGWATSSWDGEQFGGLERGPFALEVLPLDAFRCEFMGRQWGVPAEFLCYNRPYTWNQAMAFTLPHDVLVRGAPVNPKLWRIMDEFGRKRAKWHPYWNNADVVQIDRPEVKVSVYSRKEKGALFVISNLGKEKTTATVVYKPKALGLSGAKTATNALSGEAIPLTKNSFQLELDSLEWRLVWIQ